MIRSTFQTESACVLFGIPAVKTPETQVINLGFNILGLRGVNGFLEFLDEQLKKWAQLKTDDVPKVSALIKQLELPALNVAEPKKS